MFIDLENEVNPQYDKDEAANREKVYKNLISNEKNLQVENSIFFNNNKNKSDYYDQMGVNDNEKIDQFNVKITEKLQNVSNFIRTDLREIYKTNDLIV
jgi:hypothetical protein